MSNTKVETRPMLYDAPVKFLVRQMNGVMRGELALDEEASKSYRNSTHDDQVNIRLELCVGASEHFKVDCYVSEVINIASMPYAKPPVRGREKTQRKRPGRAL